jgi:hypothetical protein
MFTVTYPILNKDEIIQIVVGDVEPDPHPDGGDYRVWVELAGPELQFSTHVYGIDALQCLWLALHTIKMELMTYEQMTGLCCMYTGFAGSEHFITAVPTDAD